MLEDINNCIHYCASKGDVGGGGYVRKKIVFFITDIIDS